MKRINKKITRRSFMSGMAASAALLATGCASDSSSTATSTSTSTSTSTDASSDVAVVEGQEYYCSDEPVSFSFFGCYVGMPFDATWPVFTEAAKYTNVTLTSGIAESATDEATAYNLMLSSGKLADFVTYSSTSDLEALGRDGALMPLNDLIAEHAPNLQAAFEEYPDLLRMATATDGNIYQIPKLQTQLVAEGDFIRMDWLEKLDLEVPDTIDDLYEVLTAFRNEDPNGTGAKDTVPFFSRQGQAHFRDVLNLWDAHDDYYVRDGAITFGPMEEEFELAMTNAVKWYKEGLIDAEIFTRGSTTRDVLLGSNLGGYCNDWFASNIEYNTLLADEIEGFSFMPIPPVKNQKGERIAHTNRTVTPGWGMAASCADPVAAIKYMDFWFTQVGSDLANFGVEGLTYTVENGVKVYTDEVMGTDKTALAVLRGYGVQYRIGMLQDFEYEIAWSDPIAVEEQEKYEQYVYVPLPKSGDNIALKYTEDEETPFQKIMTSVDPYVEEMIQKWVLGSVDFESTYPDFIAQLEKYNIADGIALTQDAYDRYIQS